jgi:hypothetical protein
VDCLACRLPSWRFKGWSSSENPSSEAQMPLMELTALQSLISAEVVSVSGCSLPPGTRCFQQLGGFSSTPAPVLRMRPGSSSPESSLSFRVRSCLSPARYPRAPSASFRVSFPFATSACEVHDLPGFPYPTTFRPQRFSRSRRFAPSRTL